MRAAVLVWALAAALPATAETISHVSQLKPGSRAFGYFFGRDQTAEMQRVGALWDRQLGLQQACKDAQRMQVMSVTLANPVELPDDKPHPVSGAWILRFSFERCGETKIYNALFLAKNGERPEARPYFPGITSASPQLVSDAMRGAVMAASVKLAKEGTKDCKVLQVFDMRVIEPPKGGPWQEGWTFQGCGARTEVRLTFTPDGKGGAYYSASDK